MSRKPLYRLEAQTDVAAPAALVWRALSDFHGVRNWARAVTRCEPLGEVRHGLGAGRRCEIEDVGAVDEYVTVWDDGRRLGYSVTPIGPIGPSASLWHVQATTTNRARVWLRLDYDMRFGPLGSLLHALVVRRRLEQSLSIALRLLKRHVEEIHAVNRLGDSAAA